MNLRSLLGIRATYAPFLAAVASFWIGHHGIWAQGVSFSQPAISPLAVGGRPTTPLIVDFNGDGRADIVVALEGDHAIAVLLGRPPGGFQPAPGSPFPAGNSPFSIAVADLNGDSKLDVVAVNRTDNQLTVLRGDGLGGFTPWGSPVPTGNEPRTVRIADFNRDGKPDLAVANYGAQSVSILLGDGFGVFTPAPGSPVTVGRNPWGLTVADFNGDGAPDFAAANRAENSVSVILNDGNARFTPAGSPIRVGKQPFDVAAGDLNHNGTIDLVSADTESYTVTVLMGDGSGHNFGTPFLPTPVQGRSTHMFIMTDLNLDGHPDLVAANEWSSPTLLLGNGKGQFTFSYLPQVPSIQNTLAVGDLNRDGAPDLVSCGPDIGLTIWLNTAAPPTLEVRNAGALESALSATVTLRRTANIGQPLSFLVSTRDDTAKAERDYQPVQTRITFAPGQVEQILTIPLIDNQEYQGNRRLMVEFVSDEETLNLAWPVFVYIQDDEELIEFEVSFSTPEGLKESQTELPITVTQRTELLGTRRIEAILTVTPIGGSRAGVDFLPITALLEFGPNRRSQTVSIPLLDDFEPDGPRTLAIKVRELAARIPGEARAEATISDDESAVLSHAVSLTQLGIDYVLDLFADASGRVMVLGGASGTLRIGRLLKTGEWDPTWTNSDPLPEELDPNFSRGMPTRDAMGQPAIWLVGTGIARLRDDGSIDPTFQPAPDFIQGSVLLPLNDGRVLNQRWEVPSGITLSALTATGQPDVTFIPYRFSSESRQVFPLPNGNILLRDGVTVKRLLPNGTPDPTYAAFQAVPPNAQELSIHKVDAHGRTYVVGSTAFESWSLRRYSVDGALDSTFPQVEVSSPWSVVVSDQGEVNIINPINPISPHNDNSNRLRIFPDGQVRFLPVFNNEMSFFGDVIRGEFLDRLVVISWAFCPVGLCTSAPALLQFESPDRDRLVPVASIPPTESAPNSRPVLLPLGGELWYGYGSNLFRAVATPRSTVPTSTLPVQVVTPDRLAAVFHRSTDSSHALQQTVRIIPLDHSHSSLAFDRTLFFEPGSTESWLSLGELRDPSLGRVSEYIIALVTEGNLAELRPAVRLIIVDPGLVPDSGVFLTPLKLFPGLALLVSATSRDGEDVDSPRFCLSLDSWHPALSEGQVPERPWHPTIPDPVRQRALRISWYSLEGSTRGFFQK
ncbi:MAG: VCBS repeat-containing protein [Verrucomicrobiales bacterium]|nr:VCBS repeat-containing protein [Verrucomicrobiales bacterium]